MLFRLILLIIFILFEPFLPVKAFFWSNFSYQFILLVLAISLFELSPGKTRRERLVLSGIILALFFRPGICGLTFPWSNSLYLLLIAGLFIISLLGMDKKEMAWIKTPLDIPLLAFLILATGYLSLSLEKMTGLRQVVSLWAAGLFYFLLVREIKSLENFQKLMIVFFLAGLRAMVYGLHQFWLGLAETRIWIETYTQGEIGSRLLNRLGCGRVFSTFVYPNAYAGFLIMLIPVSFFFFVYNRGYKRMAAGLLGALSFFSLYLTYSKGGWLSLALTFFLAFIFLLPRIRFGQKLLVALLFLALISGLVMALESTGSSKLGFKASFRVRAEYWQAALHMIRDRPIRGYGLGNFGEIYAHYKLPLAEETQMAHNNYLQVWVEMGLAGFLIFLWLVFIFFRSGLFPAALEARSPEVQSLLQGALWGGVAFFIHSLVDFDFYVPNLTFSLFFFMAVVMGINIKGRPAAGRQRMTRTTNLLFGGVVFLVLVYHQSNYLQCLFTLEKIDNLISTNDFKSAGEELEGLIAMDEFNPKLHFEKARLNELSFSRERRRAGLAEAIYGYSLASRLNPHRASYHFNLGRLYWAWRDEPRFLKKAVSEFRLAHQAYPSKKEYQQVLESVRQYLEREDEK